MREVYQHLQDVHSIHQNFFERLAELQTGGVRPRRVLEPGLYVEGDRLYVESARVLIDPTDVLMKLFRQAVKEKRLP